MWIRSAARLLHSTPAASALLEGAAALLGRVLDGVRDVQFDSGKSSRRDTEPSTELPRQRAEEIRRNPNHPPPMTC